MNKKLKSILVVACCLFTTNQVSAQSWKDLFSSDNVSSVVSAVSEAVGISSSINMVGTWAYSGSAVEFESENLLTKAGGVVAASTVESKIDEQLKKVGITEGTTTFTFSVDSTFTCVTSKRTINGTYSYQSDNSTVSFKYGALPATSAKVSGSSSSLSLLFEADKLLQFLTLVGSKVNNTTLKTISSLASQYDGMNLGIELKKQ